MVNAKHTLPAEVKRLCDANPDVELRVTLTPSNTIETVARQKISRFAVGTLQLADISLYTKFSIPWLCISTTREQRRFRAQLYAEIYSGGMHYVPLNDDWGRSEPLLLDNPLFLVFLDNSLLVSQLLLPQANALADAVTELQRLHSHLSPQAVIDTGFGHALLEYQLEKYRLEFAKSRDKEGNEHVY